MSNITHYGPAPTGGDSLSAIDHQSEGTLSCLVQQRTNSYVEYDERNGRFSAVYKGPTTVIRNLARKIPIGSSLSDVLTIIEEEISIVNRFENPLPYEGLTWLVESVKVD